MFFLQSHKFFFFCFFIFLNTWKLFQLNELFRSLLAMLNINGLFSVYPLFWINFPRKESSDLDRRKFKKSQACIRFISCDSSIQKPQFSQSIFSFFNFNYILFIQLQDGSTQHLMNVLIMLNKLLNHNYNALLEILYFRRKLNMSIKKINGYKIFLSEELGKGSYGAVYKGEQDKSKQACAIKIIDKKNINSDPYLKSALFSQIQILGKLNSENIVKLFDVMESSHNYYIVQELCDSDLEKFLKNHHHGAVDEEEAIKMLTHICNGFLTLVREGVVHRDMKPANILISGGAVKIADFGFAKENIHRKVKNESSVGTPMYMSVEVLKGKTYTSKCDIWAIGVIFYEMLYGKTPWKAKSQFQLVSSIIKKPIVLDPKLKKQTKDFLECTLKTYEKDRICWDDLFQHPIFDGYFHKYLDESKEFENKYKAVMGDLRFRVNAENIDIKKLWKNLGYKEEKELNFKEFQKFLNAIIPNMKKAQQSYFFEQMDANGDGNLSLHELQVQLEKFNISLTPRLDEKVQFRRTMTIKPQNGVDDSDSEQKQVEVDQQFQRKVNKCFVKLNKILENKKLTLYQTFVAYDADKSGQLTLDQFSKIMCRLDSSFTNQQLQCVFKLIDADSSNTIEFDQLNAYYCRVNCLPEVMDLPMQYREKRFAKKMTYFEKAG